MRNTSLLCSLLLAGCAAQPETSVPPSQPLNIYQPSILSLKAGTRVETKEGVYTPQTDEVWHSDKRYRELERAGF